MVTANDPTPRVLKVGFGSGLSPLGESYSQRPDSEGTESRGLGQYPRACVMVTANDPTPRVLKVGCLVIALGTDVCYSQRPDSEGTESVDHQWRPDLGHRLQPTTRLRGY